MTGNEHELKDKAIEKGEGSCEASCESAYPVAEDEYEPQVVFFKEENDYEDDDEFEEEPPNEDELYEEDFDFDDDEDLFDDDEEVPYN
jgi:hypothetical protein